MISIAEEDWSKMSVPKFTNVSYGKPGEEIDLNEIFSDYFMQEFDDPVNNPYSAMLAIAAQQQQHQVNQDGTIQMNSQSFALPTGRGIMTPFHIGALPTLSASAAHQLAVNQQQQQQQQSQQQQQQIQQLHNLQQLQQQHVQQAQIQIQQHIQQAQIQQQQQQTGNYGASESDQTFGHVVKKHKGGITLNMNSNSGQNIGPGSQLQTVNSSSAPVAASGISSRLGISVGSGGQVYMPNAQNQGQDIPQAQQGHINGVNPPSAVSLPIGHGIRLGGVIGTTAGQPSNLNVLNHAQWGDKSKGGPGGQLFFNPEGGLSQQVIEERRQRNREHAKRSRVRKKFLLESLQEEVKGLQDENKELRLIIQEHIPEQAQQILAEICSGSVLFDDPPVSDGEGDKGHDGTGADSLSSADFTLMKALMAGQQCFVLSDPRLPDNPIVFASQGFYDLTGYTREEVLGRNCRFLQGPGTDPRAVDVIRTAVSKGTETAVLLLNYKADGTPFWNQFFIAPLRGADDNIVNYVGVQCLVEPDAGAMALEEKVNAILPLQNKDDDDDFDHK